MNCRPYDPEVDRADLWSLKRPFELELGAGTDTRRPAYEAKLTDGYRDRYLDWVDRCVAESPDCVTVAEADDDLVGYAFLLPESLSLVWDAAILNEIYVDPGYRGTGLADRLLEACLHAARQQSLPMARVVLDVSATNERARSFYRRHGFRPWGELVVRELEPTAGDSRDVG